jgi:hypothetical protein
VSSIIGAFAFNYVTRSALESYGFFFNMRPENKGDMVELTAAIAGGVTAALGVAAVSDGDWIFWFSWMSWRLAWPLFMFLGIHALFGVTAAVLGSAQLKLTRNQMLNGLFVGVLGFYLLRSDFRRGTIRSSPSPAQVQRSDLDSAMSVLSAIVRQFDSRCRAGSQRRIDLWARG